MRNLHLLCHAVTLMCAIAICAGSGGGGGHGSSSESSIEGVGDGVTVLRPPRDLKLTCNTTREHGTTYNVDWFKGDDQLQSNDRVSYDNSKTAEKSLIIKETTAEGDTGTYSCRSLDDGTGQGINQTFDVVTLSYSKLAKSTTALEGDKLSLTCSVQGTPMPTIVWYKGNETITGDERIQLSTKEGAPINSTLVITETVFDDRGTYTCFFSNHDEINLSTETNVRIKDMYAALWPFLGIVVEVVLLCLIIFVYEKRRSKADYEESDTDTQANTKAGH